MNDSKKFALTQTLWVFIGEAILVAFMFAVFALLKVFNLAVLLGGVVGVLLATGNFYFMAMAATLAAEKAKNQDVRGGELVIKSSYSLRLFALVAILLICGISGYFNPFTLVLPLAFVRPVVVFCGLFQKR